MNKFLKIVLGLFVVAGTSNIVTANPQLNNFYNKDIELNVGNIVDEVTNTMDSLARSFLTGNDVQLAIQSRLQNNDPYSETTRTAQDMWSKEDDEDVTLE